MEINFEVSGLDKVLIIDNQEIEELGSDFKDLCNTNVTSLKFKNCVKLFNVKELQNSGITSLYLMNTNLQDIAHVFIPTLKKLFLHNTFNKKSTPKFSKLSTKPNIKVIKFIKEKNDEIIKKIFAKTKNALPKLQKVTFIKCNITEKTFPNLKHISTLKIVEVDNEDLDENLIRKKLNDNVTFTILD